MSVTSAIPSVEALKDAGLILAALDMNRLADEAFIARGGRRRIPKVASSL